MDIVDTQHAIGLSGFPDELKKLIWKRKKDEDYVQMYLDWKKRQING